MNYTAIAITAIICITILMLCHEPKRKQIKERGKFMKIATIKREPEDMVYTVEEVATIMRASKQYVYTLINANQIRVLKIPHTRIRKSELERFFRDNEGKDLTNPNEPKDIVIQERRIICGKQV